MVKFVWLTPLKGGEIPINPERVCYLQRRKDNDNLTEVVFDGVAGGLHSVVIEGSGREVAAELERGVTVALMPDLASCLEPAGAPLQPPPAPRRRGR